MATNIEFKYIFVELEEVGSCSRVRSFDVEIEKNGKEGETDCNRVVNAIIRDHPECKDLLTSSELSFSMESVRFPNRYVEISKKATIEDGRSIKCFALRGQGNKNNALDYLPGKIC